MCGAREDEETSMDYAKKDTNMATGRFSHFVLLNASFLSENWSGPFETGLKDTSGPPHLAGDDDQDM